MLRREFEKEKNLWKKKIFLKGKDFFLLGCRNERKKPLKEKNLFERKNLFENVFFAKDFFWAWFPPQIRVFMVNHMVFRGKSEIWVKEKNLFERKKSFWKKAFWKKILFLLPGNLKVEKPFWKKISEKVFLLFLRFFDNWKILFPNTL